MSLFGPLHLGTFLPSVLPQENLLPLRKISVCVCVCGTYRMLAMEFLQQCAISAFRKMTLLIYKSKQTQFLQRKRMLSLKITAKEDDSH